VEGRPIGALLHVFPVGLMLLNTMIDCSWPIDIFRRQFAMIKLVQNEVNLDTLPVIESSREHHDYRRRLICQKRTENLQ